MQLNNVHFNVFFAKWASENGCSFIVLKLNLTMLNNALLGLKDIEI
jgi:hypothetical protein